MPLVICPECKSEVELEKRYCPTCTAPLPPNAMPAPDRTVPVNTTINTGRGPIKSLQLDAVAGKSRTIAIVVAVASAVVLLAVVGFVIYQSKLSQTANGVAPPVTFVPAGGGAPRVAMPIDVKTYLTFLESIEQSRAELRGGLNAATVSLSPIPAAPGSTPPGPAAPLTTPPPPPQNQPAATPAATTGAPGTRPGNAAAQPTPPVSGAPVAPPPPANPAPTVAGEAVSIPPPAPSPAFTAYEQKWQDMIKQFNAQSPPKDCQVVADDYYRLLQDYDAMLRQMATTQPPTVDGINQIETTAQSQIRSDALVADNALKNLSDSYAIVKPFTIAPELVPAPPSTTSPG